MTQTLEASNDAVRQAVEARRAAQAAGKPLEEWYTPDVKSDIASDTDSFQPVTPSDLGTSDEVSSNVDVPWLEPYIQHLLEHQRLRGDGITHEQRPGSLPFLELLEEVRQLHLSKSQDYGSESDPLANIRQGAEFVNIEPWRGCMVRIADKVQRLRTFCQTGRLVHEGVRDTLLDLSAYSLLAIVLFDEGTRADA
jgi:hypothetical protein